ncbi:uncharacterized protein TNCV_2762481 [Trichonephila clavipes]|nr:uncharacterized protein TNCV_2762481 [Trichonephila clavipes]
MRAVGSLVFRASDSRPEGLVRCPMPQNTLRVHTEYVLVKSVGPKVLWDESRVQGTGEYFPPPSVPCPNCGDRWCRHLLSLREFFVLSPVWCSRPRPTTSVLLAPCYEKFCGPRSDYIRQVALTTTVQ